MIKKICSFLIAFSFCYGESPSLQEKTKPLVDFSLVTDLCWGCFLPIHLATYNLSPSQKDFVKYQKPPPWWRRFCACEKINLFGAIPLYTKLGLPLAFWEPQAIMEVTKIPNKSMTLFHSSGTLDKPTYKNVGSISNSDAGRSSFYNVHYYMFPLARSLFVIPGLNCLKEDLTLFVFRTEWLPFWSDMDSEWHWIIDPLPIRLIYGDHRLQELCKKDCEAATKRTPTDAYPWCAGCLGSVYPFCGHVSYHIGGIQASSLLVCRFLAMLHALGAMPGGKALGLGTGFEEENFCHKTWSYRLKKTLYKTQLLFPKADQGQEKDDVKVFCHPLGESDREWAKDGFTWPIDGEDFVYVIWTKMHCCFNFLEPLQKFLKNDDASEGLTELINSVLNHG